MKSYKYIIVGGGMAGDSAVQGIREVDKTGSIALIGAENFPPYIRPPLTKGLWTGKKKLEEIWRQTAAHQVDLYLNQRVTAIDAHKKVVTDDQGLEFEYERLLLATRQDLERVLDGISEDDLHKELSGEDWPIVGILNHVALAEQWYFDRMGIALPTRELPTDPLDRLVKVRDHTLANLSNLATRIGVVALSGETWSARKVMRRTLWHERDHTDHISKLKLRLR